MRKSIFLLMILFCPLYLHAGNGGLTLRDRLMMINFQDGHSATVEGISFSQDEVLEANRIPQLIRELNSYYSHPNSTPSVWHRDNNTLLISDDSVELSITPAIGSNVWMTVHERDNGNSFVIPTSYEEIDSLAPAVIEMLEN